MAGCGRRNGPCHLATAGPPDCHHPRPAQRAAAKDTANDTANDAAKEAANDAANDWPTLMPDAPQPPPARKSMTMRVILGMGLVMAVSAGLILSLQATDQSIFTEDWIRRQVSDLGLFGPLALIGLMVLAVVASPVPSGPIAVAAGALYGTLWGGSITAIGAVLGAILAFASARYLGLAALQRSRNPVIQFIVKPRSQGALMLIVFASRLIPFISFDAVSYAAGVTCLSVSRFILATSVGVLPISYALAAMGAGIAKGGPDWMWIVGLGGAITLLPMAGKWIWDKTRKPA